MPGIGGICGFMCGGMAVGIDGWLDMVGEVRPGALLKVGVVLVGEAPGGVGLALGDVVACWKPCMGGGNEVTPGSSFGAILEPDLREWWCLLKIAR